MYVAILLHIQNISFMLYCRSSNSMFDGMCRLLQSDAFDGIRRICAATLESTRLRTPQKGSVELRTLSMCTV